MPLHSNAKMVRKASAASWLAWKPRKDRGRKICLETEEGQRQENFDFAQRVARDHRSAR